MGLSYAAGDLAQEAQPLLSDHDHDNDHQHAEGRGSLPPMPARIQKITSIQDENLEEESFTDGDQPQKGLSEAERLVLIDSLAWNHRPSILWLMPFVFILALMMGIAMAAQGQQIIFIICKDYFRGKGHSVIEDWDDAMCKNDKVQAFAAIVMSHLSSIKNIFGIFTVGYYTSQSDHRGRKFLIYLTLVPSLFSQMLIIHMGKLHSNLGLWPLYVDAILTGCLGAEALLLPGLNAYLGAAIGKAIYDETQEKSIVLMVAMTTSVCLIFYTIALPESRPMEVRIAEASRMPFFAPHSSEDSTSFPSKAKRLLKQTLEPLLLFLPGRIEPTENELPTRYTLLLLVGAYACGQFASSGILAVFIPYSNLVYHWGTSENGSYFFFSGLSTLVVYLVIFPGLQYAYRYLIKPTGSVQLPNNNNNNMDIEEISAMLHHVSANTGVHVADIAIVPTIKPTQEPFHGAKQDVSIKMDMAFFVLGNLLYTVGLAIVPMFETDIILYTSYVPSYQTGKALGGVAILDAILQASAALLYASIFAATAGTVPSAVYFVSTGMWMISTATTVMVLGGYRRRWAQRAV
ncbi:hypothetical protein BGZ47_005389 [Haplosporangium gracile]|nr:hypothetical protein BGZ47_005389 [Haplosporangium gracile]